MTSQTRCAAAKGIPGANLICVDFSTIQDGVIGTPPPTKLARWDFDFCSLALSVIHQVHLDSTEQKAPIMFGGDDEQQKTATS